MATVVISGGNIRSERELHALLASELNFGQYYGKNLDALWDRLTTDVERPVRIVWKDALQSRKWLGGDRFEKIIGVLRAVEARDESRGKANRFTLEVIE